jgi:aarF domain-containing kinase
LVDEWAARFFEELDYINEGENGSLFAEMMRKDLPQVSLKAQTIQFLCVC